MREWRMTENNYSFDWHLGKCSRISFSYRIRWVEMHKLFDSELDRIHGWMDENKQKVHF